MKIAILVWGSLYWDKRNLETTGEWYYDGPSLPIEFARISSGQRLTLVIKPHFDNVTLLYAVSTFENLDEAIVNLRSREGTTNLDNIGFIDIITNRHRVREANNFIIKIIRQWNEEKNFDAIIWSDFSPYFRDKLGVDFDLANVKKYLKELPADEKKMALEYIRKSPKQIITRYRKDIETFFLKDAN